jgi:hypothetical protein
MSWQEGVAVALVLVGLMAGGYIAAQRPAFWIEFGGRIFKKLLPIIFAYATKRMPPEQEKAWRDCERRGGKWNHFKKRCENR